MLVGEEQYKLGQKHRLAIPKKFRQILGDSLIISRGYEGCLIVVNQQMWLNITQPISQGSFLDQNTRASARFLMGGAHQVTLDSQGRCIIPAPLYEHAGFDQEVVFVGLGQWLEVWSLERWQSMQTQLADQGSVIAQKLAATQSFNKNEVQ